MIRYLALIAVLYLGACATTPKPKPSLPPEPEITTPAEIPNPSVEMPEPEEGPFPNPLDESQTPEPEETPMAPEPVSDDPLSLSADFDQLSGWTVADHMPAFSAFERTCRFWDRRDPDRTLHMDHPNFGTLADWAPACSATKSVSADDPDAARRFFERWFVPVQIPNSQKNPGLMTGYYQPEVEARRTPDKIYREPILAVPSLKTNQRKPRSEISAAVARVIAYGRPIDVFFMQIQGSGILVFPDGSRLRAAYADNNGYPYTSIGRILVERGELTKTDASKQTIEAWMKSAGPLKARTLMNENKRYIFFKEQTLVAGEGPLGGMQVPLTAMGSVAIDRRFYPYGLPIWIETRLPDSGGDYRGTPQALLVIAQDTGQAIKGEQRGDIYFGTGPAAGEKAGVMKHPGIWTFLLPRPLAASANPS